MVNGKQKGASFEREVCRDLSRFVDPDGTDTLFWRSSMSGGRGTLHRRKGVRNTTQLGDVTCVHESGHWLTQLFYLELKFYRDLDLANSLVNGRGKLASFWRETAERAAEAEREPLLIAKQNRFETLVVFGLKGLAKFRSYGYTPRVVLTSTDLGKGKARRTGTAQVCLYREVFT